MSETRFYNHDSTILDPDPQRSYVNKDGSIAVIKYGKCRKWCIIIDVTITDNARTFESAMKKIQKYNNKKVRTAKKLAQSSSNALADLLN